MYVKRPKRNVDGLTLCLLVHQLLVFDSRFQSLINLQTQNTLKNQGLRLIIFILVTSKRIEFFINPIR